MRRVQQDLQALMVQLAQLEHRDHKVILARQALKEYREIQEQQVRRVQQDLQALMVQMAQPEHRVPPA